MQCNATQNTKAATSPACRPTRMCAELTLKKTPSKSEKSTRAAVLAYENRSVHMPGCIHTCVCVCVWWWYIKSRNGTSTHTHRERKRERQKQRTPSCIHVNPSINSCKQRPQPQEMCTQMSSLSVYLLARELPLSSATPQHDSPTLLTDGSITVVAVCVPSYLVLCGRSNRHGALIRSFENCNYQSQSGSHAPEVFSTARRNIIQLLECKFNT